MKINMQPVSFNGLWFKKEAPKNISKYEYRPFSDESPEKIQREIDKYNGRTRIYYPGGFKHLGQRTKIQAEAGEKLNITTEEYGQLDKHGPGAWSHSREGEVDII